MVEMESIDKKKFIKKIVVSTIGLVSLFALIYFVLHIFGLTNISKEEMQEFISSTGAVAPLIYILVTFLQVTFIPIPSTVTIVVGSYLFGVGLAFIYSYIGMLIGSMLAYYLGKVLGRPFINWVSGSKEETDKWMSKLNGKENIVLFFIFLFPMFPDDLICSIAGVLPITAGSFFIMQVITRATTIAGSLIFMSGSVIPFNWWGITLIILAFLLCFIVFVYCFKHAEKINDYFGKIKRKIFKEKNKNNA